MIEYQINDRVKHRAWHHMRGLIVDVPFEYNKFGSVTVLWDDSSVESEAWIPALMRDEEAEYDWGELL